MTTARAKIWAKLIHAGIKSIDDVPEDDREQVEDAFNTLYGGQ